MLIWKCRCVERRARVGDAPTVATKRDGDQPRQAWRRTQLEAGETSVQLQSTNARTPPKTEEYRDQRARRFNNLQNPTKSAKPPPPVQIRAAPPTFAHACQRARELRLASHAKVAEPAGRDLLIDLIALRHLTQTDGKDAHVLNDHKPCALRCAHLSQWRRFLSVWSAGISSASVDAT